MPSLEASPTPEELIRLGPLDGGGRSTSVELVRWRDERFVLKTDRPGAVEAQLRFAALMADGGLPSLACHRAPDRADQLLVEYVEGSPTLAKAMGRREVAQWGRVVRLMHSVRYSRLVALDEAGEPQATLWPEFIAARIDKTLQVRRDAGDLRPSVLARAGAYLDRLRRYRPQRFVLTHGDLNADNALVRDREVVLIDKAGAIWAAPPLFDLALLYVDTFPGAICAELAGRDGDGALAAAFFSGYRKIAAQDQQWLELFVLLQALRRYPRPSSPWLEALIEGIVSLQQARRERS